MNKLISNLKFIFMPKFWFRVYEYNEIADEIINEIIDEHKTVKIKSYYYADIDGVEIWIQNYPYAYGQINGLHGMPSRKTVLRLYTFLKPYVIEFHLSEKNMIKGYKTK